MEPGAGPPGGENARSEALTVSSFDRPPHAPGVPAGGATGPALEPGVNLGGRYHVVAFAQRGGMGEVYRAEDVKLDQPVALKCLPAEVASEPRLLARLLQEVRVARRVSHPNVCRVYDIAEADGRHFLTMEWIAGESLAAVLARNPRVPHERAVDLARQICAGLAAAHDQGVIHRDLKPSNVMVDARGIAHITDFGLAELAQAVAGGRAREGTPHYMSPEQLAGRGATAASDIYALGLVLFELFTGRRAHDTETFGETLAQRQLPPPSPRSVAPELKAAVERVIMRCLDPDPERRPPSAREVAAALPGGLPASEAAEAAQRRADRIADFKQELAELLRTGVLAVDDASLAAVERFHARVLRDLAEQHDVDVTEQGKQLSLGLRLVSLLGALAFAASAFFFVNRIWGLISSAAQVGILLAAPTLGVVLTGVLGARRRLSYFTAMAAAFSFACFAIDISLLGTLYNMQPSPLALLASGVFGLVLAYGFELKLVLVAGLAYLAYYVAALVYQSTGGHWPDALMRPESVLATGVGLILVSALLRRGQPPGFPHIYRYLGAVLVLVPTVSLAASGRLSYLPLAPRTVEVLYQLLGFAASTAALAWGLRARSREAAYFGAILFILMLYLKFVDWWWNWMPKYAFFLIVALTAVVVVAALGRLRTALAGTGQGVRA